MKRTTTSLGLAVLLAMLAGCQSVQVAGGPTKSSAKGPFVGQLGDSITSNGFTPLYPVLVSGVGVQLSDARIFAAGDPATGRVDFKALVMPHPTRADKPTTDPDGPRTVSFTPYNSMPSLRLQNGLMYLTGRWRVPATTRVKGGHDGASMTPTRAEAGEPEGGSQYDGLLLVWVNNDEEWWFWQPSTGSDSLPLSLSGSQTPATDVIPAKSYVRLKSTGSGMVITETHPFNQGTVAHDARVREVFNTALFAAGAAGLQQMEKLSP